MSDYVADVAKYVDGVDEDAVDAIVKYCGIALRSGDASRVAASDPKELQTIKDGFAAKKLALTPAQADEGIAKVCEMMKGDNAKSRVAFYYLLALATETMSRLT